jgi:hypothetical protein
MLRCRGRTDWPWTVTACKLVTQTIAPVAHVPCRDAEFITIEDSGTAGLKALGRSISNGKVPSDVHVKTPAKIMLDPLGFADHPPPE